MNEITFVVDSGSDYESNLSSYLNFPVRVVPLHINIDGNEYLDGVDLSKIEFYQKMEQAVGLPKTSQPTPHFFHEVFQEELDKGNQILFIGISSKLSGTYQSAVIAKEMFSIEDQQKIFLVDSLNISATIVILLMKANDMLLNGHSLDEVVNELNEYRSKVSFLALLDTLENLKKGGRISAAQAAIGSLLNIKPLISIEHGLIKSLDKFRGRKKGLQYISEQLNDLSNQINKGRLFIVHNFFDKERLMKEMNHIDLSKFKEIIHVKLGATIGTHAGSNMIGFAYEQHV